VIAPMILMALSLVGQPAEKPADTPVPTKDFQLYPTTDGYQHWRLVDATGTIEFVAKKTPGSPEVKGWRYRVTKDGRGYMENETATDWTRWWDQEWSNRTFKDSEDFKLFLAGQRYNPYSRLIHNTETQMASDDVVINSVEMAWFDANQPGQSGVGPTTAEDVLIAHGEDPKEEPEAERGKPGIRPSFPVDINLGSMSNEAKLFGVLLVLGVITLAMKRPSPAPAGRRSVTKRRL
jgi:hypothetical protein